MKKKIRKEITWFFGVHLRHFSCRSRNIAKSRIDHVQYITWLEIANDCCSCIVWMIKRIVKLSQSFIAYFFNITPPSNCRVVIRMCLCIIRKMYKSKKLKVVIIKQHTAYAVAQMSLLRADWGLFSPLSNSFLTTVISFCLSASFKKAFLILWRKVIYFQLIYHLFYLPVWFYIHGSR